MQNSNQTPSVMGMSHELFERYNREYMRQNPYDLPELRRRQRARFARKVGTPERVYSTRRFA